MTTKLLNLISMLASNKTEKVVFAAKIVIQIVEIGRPSATRGPRNSKASLSFEDKAQTASLRGAAKADPANFGKWMAETHPGSGMDDVLSGEVFIDYDAFCEELAGAINRVLMKKRAGENTLTSMRQGTAEADAAVANQWVIREFDLVESLICQLELMRPGARRRALISLQYALLSDTGSGQIDGFGLVSALLGAGFSSFNASIESIC